VQRATLASNGGYSGLGAYHVQLRARGGRAGVGRGSAWIICPVINVCIC
jgi:hypothetical protein